MQQPPLPLLCAQPQATPGSHRHVWRATAMFRDGSVGSKKSGFVIVWSQIPGGKFLACFSGRISNHRPAANPLRPGPGNPINCPTEGIGSIDPHSGGLWLADKRHSHVETNAWTEVVQAPQLLPSPPWVWSRRGLITLWIGAGKQEITEQVFGRLCLLNVLERFLLTVELGSLKMQHTRILTGSKHETFQGRTVSEQRIPS